MPFICCVKWATFCIATNLVDDVLPEAGLCLLELDLVAS